MGKLFFGNAGSCPWKISSFVVQSRVVVKMIFLVWCRLLSCRIMVRKYAPFRCFISLFKAVLPAMLYYILYRTSIFACCFRQKEVWSSCPHLVRFITALIRISLIFSFPFFRFMGFFCFCSRQGIAIPYCCHAAFFRCMSQCSNTTVYVMSPLVTVVWL